MSIGMVSADVLVCGLARLVRPLMVAYMGCLVVSVVCSANLARYAVFSNQMVMCGCFVNKKSYSGVGPSGRISRLLANSPTHRLAKNGDLGFGLESVSVREYGARGSLLIEACGNRSLLFGECRGLSFGGGH